MSTISKIKLNGTTYDIKDASAGKANGLATLDSAGKVPSAQLPSYVDDVLEYDSFAGFPATGESGKVYIAKDTNKTYRWGGSTYVTIGTDLALGETSTTAFAGDKGKTAYDHSKESGNPHGTTAEDVGALPTDSSGMLKKLNASDGGRLYLEKADTTELLGNVAIDTYQNKVRIFENGGQYRGAFLDLTKYGSNVGNEIITTAGGTLTGNLEFKKVENGYGTIYKNHSDTADYGTNLKDVSVDGKQATLCVNAPDGILEFYDGTGWQLVYHQGNKPKASDIGIVTGSSTFNKMTGRAITHSFGAATAYTVSITPTAAGQGNLGDYYVVKGNNTMTVYNTGTATTSFDYTIIKK